MKCLVCGAELKTHLGMTKYRSLASVALVGVEIRTCESCGEEEVVIPRIAELNRVLAESLVRRLGRLTGPEVRYLRKYLGLSGTDFARRMGVAKETVSRWETEKKPMSTTAERLLRLMVAHESPIGDYSASFFDDLEEKSGTKHEDLEFRAGPGGWEPTSACC